MVQTVLQVEGRTRTVELEALASDDKRTRSPWIAPDEFARLLVGAAGPVAALPDSVEARQWSSVIVLGPMP